MSNGMSEEEKHVRGVYESRFEVRSRKDIAEIERLECALTEAAGKALLSASKYSDIVQAITDPENQPSQYGTVTIAYHRAAIAELAGKVPNAQGKQPATTNPTKDENNG